MFCPHCEQELPAKKPAAVTSWLSMNQNGTVAFWDAANLTQATSLHPPRLGAPPPRHH
jgi:hypothetical protein